jgi:hypothetical protein
MSTSTWEGLEFLAGIDLDGRVPCEWSDLPSVQEPTCERPAAWVMIQRHQRPPFACIRSHLCDEHRAVVRSGERDLLKAGATGRPPRLICTLHLRPVETLTRWEHL